MKTNINAMIPKPPEHVAMIADTASLTQVCKRMRARDWIVVDTEFLRERTYYPKLCLVQIADSQEIAIIDVLTIDNLRALAELLSDPHVCKVFHSAEQDLEVLNLCLGAVPAPLFDTQIAAALVGQDNQIGYARLIAALIDVDLAKSHTRTDWSRRPLPAGALDYAADDVRYLASAYPVLRDKLDAHGRLDWLDDDFERLADPARFAVDSGDAWRRVRGWHRLRAGQQQVLAELAAWREGEAMASDRPRKWILGDDALMEIARRRPADAAQLNAIRALPAKTTARHEHALLACVVQGNARSAVPLAERPQPPDAQEKRLIRIGMDRLGKCADETGIAAAALASRKEIAGIVAGARNTRLLSGWRAKAAGSEVLEAIEDAQAGRSEANSLTGPDA